MITFASFQAKLSDFGSHFGASCMRFSRGGAFFRNLFFGTSGGYPPWTDFGLPWDTLRPILSTVWKMLVANCLQNSRLQSNICNQPHLQKNKQRLTNNFTDQQFKRVMFFFCS